MPPDDFLTKRARLIILMIQTLGFPIVVACVLLWGGWLVGSRLVNSHEQFIESLAAEHGRQGATLKEIAAAQTETVKVMTNIDKRLRGDKYTVLATKPQDEPAEQ